jgi:hypothetical protein
MLVPHKNHKKPKKRIKESTAVAYSRMLKYVGVRPPFWSEGYGLSVDSNMMSSGELTGIPTILKSSVVTINIRAMFDNNHE